MGSPRPPDFRPALNSPSDFGGLHDIPVKNTILYFTPQSPGVYEE